MHTITFTTEQLAVIGQALRELPYKVARPLIEDVIGAQLEQQSQQAEKQNAEAPDGDQEPDDKVS